MRYFIVVLLTVFIIGCSSNPVETEIVQMNVPEQHIPDCPPLVYSGDDSLEAKLDFIPVAVKYYQNCRNQVQGLIRWNDNVIQDKED